MQASAQDVKLKNSFMDIIYVNVYKLLIPGEKEDRRGMVAKKKWLLFLSSSKKSRFCNYKMFLSVSTSFKSLKKKKLFNTHYQP